MKHFQRFIFYIKRYVQSHKAHTVRNVFSISFVTATALMAAALLFEDTSYIRVASDERVIEAGEQFSVDVYAGAHVSVNAVDVVLTFPRDQVEVLGIDTGESVISIWTEDPSVEGNKIILSGGTFRRGFIGEHLLATINFRATESGRATVAIEDTTLLAGDGTGDSVSVSTTDDNQVAILVANEDGSLSGDFEIIISTDIDGNGEVSLKDVESFMTAWAKRDRVFDFNNDNRMNFTDFAIILADSFFR